MGKGGTKFCGDAVGVRSGRGASTYTNKELRSNMEKFLETGVHPDLERARQEASTSGPLVPLPNIDINRPYIFMDISVDNKPAGRLVIELFEDLVPVAATQLRNRCLPGAKGSLSGASFHKLLRNYALHGGKSAAVATAQRMHTHGRLKHIERGTVSVSLDGTEFVIGLAHAPALDATHQVVGRVNIGADVLDTLADVPTTSSDAPLSRLRITRCGATNHNGTHDALEDSLGKETAEQAAARLAQQSADTRCAVLEALQAGGLGAKRRAAGAAPGASGRDGGEVARRSVKPKMMDALLDELSSGEGDSSSSSSGDSGAAGAPGGSAGAGAVGRGGAQQAEHGSGGPKPSADEPED